jgi:hypothetical protein
MTKSKRVNIRGILADPDLRRKLMVSTVQATQAREGIETTKPQAERAYYVVNEGEKTAFFELEKYRFGRGDNDLREEAFVKALRDDSKARFNIARRDFDAIEGSPLTYKRLHVVAALFRRYTALNQLADLHQGVIVGFDAPYLRFFWEVEPRKQGRPWKQMYKGGDFSRFYYDTPLVIDWSYKAQSEFHRIRDISIYFKSGLTWARRTQKGFNLRRLPAECIFSDRGPAMFFQNPELETYFLGVANTALSEFILQALISFGSWELTALRRFPLAIAEEPVRRNIETLVNDIFCIKSNWDEGNEISTRFIQPWVVNYDIDPATPVAKRLDVLIGYEIKKDKLIQQLYAELNNEVYRLYNIPDSTRKTIEESLGERPPELIWPQMEGKDTDQKRMEHVWRLLSYVVKRVVEADEDGIVSLIACAGETSLLERVQHELAELFPDQDITQVEVAIVNELKRKVKGYRRTESIQEWLETVYFDYHASLYKKRPIFWHIASTQAPNLAAFSALVHYHRFDHNRLAKLRSHYLRDAIDLFRRESALAAQEERADDRLDWQTRLEEAETLEQRLKWVQEGYHEGAEDSPTDYRILTPWKSPAERPNGWNPDLDDGVAVNIAPFQKAGILRIPKVV